MKRPSTEMVDRQLRLMMPVLRMPTLAQCLPTQKQEELAAGLAKLKSEAVKEVASAILANSSPAKGHEESKKGDDVNISYSTEKFVLSFFQELQGAPCTGTRHLAEYLLEELSSELEQKEEQFAPALAKEFGLLWHIENAIRVNLIRCKASKAVANSALAVCRGSGMAEGGWHFKCVDPLVDKKLVPKDGGTLFLELSQAFFQRIDLLEHLVSKIEQGRQMADIVQIEALECKLAEVGQQQRQLIERAKELQF